MTKASKNKQKNPDNKITTDDPIKKFLKKSEEKKTNKPKKTLNKNTELTLENKVQNLENEIVALKAEVQKLAEKIDKNDAGNNVYLLTPNII